MLKAVAGAVQNDRDGAAGTVEHLGDLVVPETFEVAQREDLGGFRAHLSENLSNALFELLAQMRFVGRVLAPVGKVLLDVVARGRASTLSRPQDVERRIDRGAMKIALRFVGERVFVSTPQEPHEDGLEDVFGILGVARDPVGRPEDALVMLSKDRLQRGWLAGGVKLGCCLHFRLLVSFLVHEDDPREI